MNVNFGCGDRALYLHSSKVVLMKTNQNRHYFTHVKASRPLNYLVIGVASLRLFFQLNGFSLFVCNSYRELTLRSNEFKDFANFG
jgi:hypothetical protein